MLHLFMLLVSFGILFYSVIPFILTRWLGMSVYQNGGEGAIHKRQIAFTFDDGPNPKYTNRLLDLLKQYQIKATFFVVGSQAEKYPAIIQRMHREGHLIGVHNYVHQTNWLMSPWRVQRDLEKSAKVIEEITGVKPFYYRPPWGILNLFDFFFLRNYQIILWSLMVGDWRNKGGSKKLEERLLKRIKPGDIILLHDSGDTLGANKDAPQHTIEALERVLEELSNQNYKYLRVDELIES